jgi:hypothetical protein
MLGALGAFMAVTPGHAQTISTCGSLQNPYGPYDYRGDKKYWGTVDIHHFTPKVESLLAGMTGSVGQDLDYTLKVAPNHHRALVAVMGWGEKNKSAHPSDLTYPVECYFERAMRLAPDDGIVRVLYAVFLTRNNRAQEASPQLEYAATLAGDNALSHINIGLAYVDMKDYDNALKQAHAAMSLGAKPGPLQDRLEKVGRWRAPVPLPDQSASASSSNVRNATPTPPGLQP